MLKFKRIHPDYAAYSSDVFEVNSIPRAMLTGLQGLIVAHAKEEGQLQEAVNAILVNVPSAPTSNWGCSFLVEDLSSAMSLISRSAFHRFMDAVGEIVELLRSSEFNEELEELFVLQQFGYKLAHDAYTGYFWELRDESSSQNGVESPPKPQSNSGARMTESRHAKGRHVKKGGGDAEAVAGAGNTDVQMTIRNVSHSGAASALPPVDVASADFDVALSFPGEVRPYVRAVAERLSLALGQRRVFYDEYYKAQLARPNLDTLLQDIYFNRSRLVVVFLCKEYDNKEWCGIEFKAIRDILKKRHDSKVMYVKSGQGHVDGVFSVDGYVDANQHNPAEVAKMILERVRLEADGGPYRAEAHSAPAAAKSHAGQDSEAPLRESPTPPQQEPRPPVGSDATFGVVFSFARNQAGGLCLDVHDARRFALDWVTNHRTHFFEEFKDVFSFARNQAGGLCLDVHDARRFALDWVTYHSAHSFKEFKDAFSFARNQAGGLCLDVHDAKMFALDWVEKHPGEPLV